MRLGVTAVGGRPALETYERFCAEILRSSPMAQRQSNCLGLIGKLLVSCGPERLGQ